MSRSLVRDLLPDRRVVARFNFTGYGNRRMPIWLILHEGQGELASSTLASPRT
jgi:hypothetical protein